MVDTTLTAALEEEHQQIDEGLEAFLAGLDTGQSRREELARASTALRRHIYLEEEFLLPPLRASGLLAPVLVMLREHGQIWRTLEALEQDTDHQAGASAAARCRELVGQLRAHNAKEEPIIYPEGDARLTEDAKRDLHAFIRNGAMPEGWVCAMARPQGAQS